MPGYSTDQCAFSHPTFVKVKDSVTASGRCSLTLDVSLSTSGFIEEGESPEFFFFNGEWTSDVKL